MQKVAFFDIDGTVFRSSLLIELVEALIRGGIFSAGVRARYEREYVAWQNREGTYEAYIGAVVQAFMTHIQGVYYGDFADIGRRVIQEHGKRTYRYTRDLIGDLRSKGYYLVAISQSPKAILDEFCALYGFHKVYGRVYEIGPRDLFTGRTLETEYITDKARIVERVLLQGDFTREDSIGVGDTESDIALLESVELPICFNPNRKLYEYAQRKGWPVMVERKDVVYTI